MDNSLPLRFKINIGISISLLIRGKLYNIHVIQRNSLPTVNHDGIQLYTPKFTRDIIMLGALFSDLHYQCLILKDFMGSFSI